MSSKEVQAHQVSARAVPLKGQARATSALVRAAAAEVQAA
ncbi:hypothetical protein Back11_51010 [Paenibacillus baekrokdamisoli]|uniref:Uncharacterized protein n=1 Tax=Paenibacillus baekrokdamisoli TaxID=1712516 RepID=A0A3G9IYW4_9BACL|nr:hypothetical protein Back11_51010 [Paenibacillus baekrokdamisoli]